MEGAVGINGLNGMHVIIDKDDSEDQLLAVKGDADEQVLPKHPPQDEKSPMDVESLLNP